MSTEFYNRNWRMPNSWNGTEDNNTKFSNYSMSFDGAEYVSITDGISVGGVYPNAMQDYTISMWLNATSFSSVQCLVFDTSSNIKFISIDSATSIRVRDGVNQRNFTVPTMSVANWYNIIVTVDNGSCKVYLNSTESTTGAQTVDRGWTINGINGYSNVHGGSFNFTGKMDHFCIFDYALTDGTGGTTNQIAELYGSSSTGVGNPMAITNGRKPVAYYPLGDYSAYNGTEYLVPNSAVSDYVFDFASNSKISTGNITSLNNVSNATYSFWFYPTSSSGSIGFLGGQSAAITAYFFSNVFYIHNLGTGYISTSIPALNQWHHVCCIFDTGSTEAFLNGVSVGTNTNGSTTTNPNGANDFEIGRANNYNFYFNSGKISNVSLFNTTLPATGTQSVQSLYNYGTPPDISSYSGLQGWWKLDASATFDGSNFSIPDDSSNSNTGTSSGMTAANLVQSNLNILSPYSRYALNFDGSSDYINCGTDSSLNTSALTVSCWVRADAFSPAVGPAIISKDAQGGTNRSFGFLFVFTDFLFQNWDSAGNENRVTIAQASNPINTDGKWHHLIATIDGTTNANGIKVYIDNVVVGQATATATGIRTSTAPFFIGGSGSAGTNYNWNGEISNVSYWNAGLTSAQVKELYNNGLPSNLNNHSLYSNLISWWTLGENMSYDSNVWTVIDEKGTNNGTGANLAPAEDSIVNGVGTTANGLSSGMGGADNILGEAPYSTSNALSYGMGVDAKSTSVPS